MDLSPTSPKAFTVDMQQKRIILLTDMSFAELKKLIKTLSLAYDWQEDEVVISNSNYPPGYR